MNHVANLQESVAAGVKVRVPLGDDRPDNSKIGPSVVIRSRLYGFLYQSLCQEWDRLYCWRSLERPRSGFRGKFNWWRQVLDVNKLVTSTDKSLGGLALSEAIYHKSGLADPRGQPSKIAVTRDKTEAVEPIGV